MSLWYGVVSREYLYEDVIPGLGYGPLSHERYFVYAKASTAARAKVIALRWFRRHERRWSWDMDDGHENPFAGMKSERITGEAE